MKPVLYTSHWKAVYEHATTLPDLVPLGFLPVRISARGPRYWSVATTFPAIKDLMPDGWMLGVHKQKTVELGPEAALEHFQRCYRRKLHTIGVEKILAQFQQLTDEYCRPIVLLCFEHEPGECHRGDQGGFASWWQAKTGETVREVEDLSALKPFTTKEDHDGCHDNPQGSNAG